MDKVVVEKEVLVPEGRRESAASNFFWAFALVAIVAIIVGALYYSGALRRLTSPPAQKTVNVEVSAPSR